jgi:hypothetical protein
MSDRPLTIDIQRPLMLKANELCLVTDQSGTVRAQAPGMGLFYRDCCYLGRYELYLDGRQPLQLASSAALGFAATVELTNPPLPGAGGRPFRADSLGIERRLIAIEQDESLVDWLRFRNFDEHPVELTLSLTFEARFQNVFILRGAPPGPRGFWSVQRSWASSCASAIGRGRRPAPARGGVLERARRGAAQRGDDERAFRARAGAAAEQGRARPDAANRESRGRSRGLERAGAGGPGRARNAGAREGRCLARRFRAGP